MERKRLAKASPPRRGTISRSRLGNEKVPAIKPMREMGTGGTAVYAGFIQQKDRASEWRGQRRWEIASDILVNISIVAASVRYFLNLIAHPEWSVVPSDPDDKEAVELAEWVEDVIHDMNTPWPRCVRRSGMHVYHGFSIQEWTAKKRADGSIGFLDIEPRPQHTIERWEIDESGTVLGMWQRGPQDQRLIGLPRGKVIYLVEDTVTDSPEGLGILRNLLEPYNRLKQYLDLEARAFERDLRGTPIGRIPYTKLRKAVANGEISKEKANELIQAMQNFVELEVKQSNTAALLDSQPYESTAADGPKVSPVMQWGIELLTGDANGLAELSQAIDRLQREMARIMTTEQLMLGDAGGNRALSQDKSRNLYLTANAVLGDVKAGANSDIIDPLWKLNSLPEEKKPRFKVEEVSFKDAETIAKVLSDLGSAGAMMTPDDPAINDLRDLMGVSRYDPEDSLFGYPGLDETTTSASSSMPSGEDLDESDTMTEARQRTDNQRGNANKNGRSVVTRKRL